ncbi:MAG: PHB depolymerase family esterase [Tardiphaga sp.]|uniref:extracellular catalytic domain type 1 short-chain-length polyhydroxyalkanoate depolymerase n=1 Tax=Tardiphaga sp. TaxID=1926292 RepID=UPI0019C97791|nr:PHB depolymerase family esterase [Tardiphaga sp.]MBC7582422.1 PHB depolymerase family esterase [Tardiphaga sp.]
MSLAKNIEFLRKLPKMPGFNGLEGMTRGSAPGIESPISEVADFGSNPGDLRMFAYLPPTLLTKPALVVVLHGCTQTAAGYDTGSGWSALAEQYGFALLMPEQKSSNNGNTCFNWFSPEDTARDSGEALSIRQMIEHMAHQHQIDRDRIFVTGLSAGGAMTSVMLATYPDVFAAGAIIAGLPHGIANTMQEALAGMYRSPARPAADLGALVRNASDHAGPWPKVSVWHGSADRTVTPANSGEIVKQWLDVHGLPPAPMASGDVDGYPREVWWNADGETVVESYTITGMAHGTPLAIDGQDKPYGAAGKFLLEAGIASSWHIAQFFGLTRNPVPRRAAIASQQVVPADAIVTARAAKKPPPETDGQFSPRPTGGRRVLDINAVITRALTAAGLMK